MGAALITLLAGCAMPAAGPTATPRAAPTAAPSRATPSSSPLQPPATGTFDPSPALTCPERVLASLTEAQRIGQLFAVGLAKDRVTAAVRDAIATRHFGTWWFTKKTSVGVAAIRSVADALQAEASTATTGGVGLFVAANQEGGRIQALSGPGFDSIASALVQGSWPASVLRVRAAGWGRQLLAAGVNLDFAPVADVVPPGTAADNAPIGQLEREYGFEPSAVAAHVAAFIQGMAEAGVLTTAKHFPGLGRVAENTDFSRGVVDATTTADDPYLEPFRRAIEAGMPAVMVSLATYERLDADNLAALSPWIIHELLRDELGFGGLVMSDSLSAAAASAIAPGTRALRFLEAGGDLIVVGSVGTAFEMADAVASRVDADPAFRARVDDAALQVLEAKGPAGLLPCGS